MRRERWRPPAVGGGARERRGASCVPVEEEDAVVSAARAVKCVGGLCVVGSGCVVCTLCWGK